MQRTLATLAAIAIAASTVAASPSIVWTEQDRLIPDPPDGHAFGISIDAHGDTVVVGDSGAGDSGEAYVFENGSQGWIQTATLTSGPHESLRFGDAVAIDGDRILVGDRRGTNFQGDLGAYIFEQNASGDWILVDELSPPEERVFSFGESVALEGDTAVVGAPGNHQRSGGYVYEPNESGDWVLETLLEANTSTHGGFYGEAVAADSDLVAVGGVNLGPDSNGGADLFRGSGSEWSVEAQLRPPTIQGLGAQAAGWSVAVEDDRVLVGDPSALGGGAAFLYHRTAAGDWNHEETLRSLDPDAIDFGWSVTLEGDTAVVGDPGSTEVGAAYVFEHTDRGWVQTARLVPQEAQLWDFGDTVHLHNGTAFVADSDARNLSTLAGPGTVFVFEQKLPGSTTFDATDGFSGR